MAELSAAWLDAPGLPAGASRLACLRVAHLPLFTAVTDIYADIRHANNLLLQQRNGRKRKRRGVKGGDQLAIPGLDSLVCPEQLVLLFR